MIEDTKGVFRSSKSKKEGQCNEKRKKEQTMTLHRKLKSEHQEPYIYPGVNSRAQQR